MCLYVGSNTKSPSPVYSGLIALSPVTEPRKAFLKKSPAPFIPVVELTFPTIHCIAPACTVMFDWETSHTNCLLLTFISDAK